MSDIFEEAEEGLRIDQYVKLAKKSAPYIAAILGGALAIALGVWGFNSWQDSERSKSSTLYTQAQTLISEQKKPQAVLKFNELTKSGTNAYKALAHMQLGALAIEDNRAAEAVKDFDAVPRLVKSPILADLAALRSAYILMDSAPYAEIEKRLTPLTQVGHPYAALAKEALALAKIQAGDLKGARTDLQNISLILGAPDGVKSRAQQYIMAIDSGDAEAARAAAKLPVAKLDPSMFAGMPPQQ